MDDFGLERPELTGTLISMEFGHGGRITQLWVSDPNIPEEGEDFQFVLAPMNIGDEIAEDYYPGTILLGARSNPDEPWIVSRNSNARPVDEEFDPGKVTFEYEFPFLEELRAVGRFYEVPGPVPQVAWDLEITNQGRNSIEIGELGFPLALNNLYEGFGSTDQGASEMFKDRVYVHKAINGAASYVFAQRMTSEPPGLVVFPGEDTEWEFYTHVPASINTHYRWEGIPVVYVHSKAAVEREEWPTWFNEHSSIILEPRETKTYHMRFAPADRDQVDNLSPVLSICGRPSIRLLPSAVVPVGVGIALEVTGATPTQFFTNVEMELETDSDEEGGFCFVKPREAGIVHLNFEDTKGRLSTTHLLFVEPVETLIKSRAQWIMDHQIHDEPGSNLHRAIVVTNLHTQEQMTDPQDYSSSFGIESSLADALFLAEKNTLYPKEEEIAALQAYVEEFLLDDVQNPGSGLIGSSLTDTRSVAINTGRLELYSVAANLYLALNRLDPSEFQSKHDTLNLAYRTAVTVLEELHRGGHGPSGSLLLSFFPDLVDTLNDSGKPREAEHLRGLIQRHQRNIRRRPFPYSRNGSWTARNFYEVFDAAYADGDFNKIELSRRLGFAARNMAPSWWWYGSDKRWLDELDAPHPAMVDKGEMVLGPSTAVNSLMFFDTLARDYSTLPEPYLRAAFGGLIGIWALVRADGAAAMAFCPDAASRQFGISPYTGDVGIGLYAYLRRVASYVLPIRNAGVATFGCHFEIESLEGSDIFIVKPWDGVGRRVIVRQVGFEVSTSFGKIEELRFDARKRWAGVVVYNPSNKRRTARVQFSGLWGTEFETTFGTYQGEGGTVQVLATLEPESETTLEIKVKA